MDLKILLDHIGSTPISEPGFHQFFLVILGAFLAYAGSKILLKIAKKNSAHTANPWDDALADAAEKSLPTIILIISLSIAINIISKQYDWHITDYVAQFRSLGVVICLAWFLIRLIRSFSKNVIDINKSNGTAVDFTTIDALSKLATIIVFVITGLIALASLGFSVSGLITAGGIGGLAIGFAAKDLLANFFGGLTIYMDRPFSLGDWIRSPDKEIEGTVEYISWRHTRIRAFNKNPIYVPNALFNNIIVENPSRMTNRRINETIGIRYDDIHLVEAIVSDVKKMLRDHPDIDNTQILIVNFTTFGPSSIDFLVYTFTKTTDWIQYQEIKQEILLKIANIISIHHAEIAFPTRTLNINTTL